jgi:hypothetical protein
MVWQHQILIGLKEWKNMITLIARFFIASVAYCVALLIAVTQLLFVGLCFLLGLGMLLIMFPVYFIKHTLFK